MGMGDLPDMYLIRSYAEGLGHIYISDKSRMAMLQVLAMYRFVPIVTTPVI